MLLLVLWACTVYRKQSTRKLQLRTQETGWEKLQLQTANSFLETTIRKTSPNNFKEAKKMLVFTFLGACLLTQKIRQR
jgi:hypothetical protein